MITRKYSYIPDTLDHRDFYLARASTEQPTVVDLRPGFTYPVFDQGKLGSCTGSGWKKIVEFVRAKEKLAFQFPASALWIYYKERELEKTISSDSGAAPRDGAKAISKWGVAPEALWPYNVKKFTTKPPESVSLQAKKYKALTYSRVPQTAIDFQACLAAGFPFGVGFSVFDSFESNAVSVSGIVPMPGLNDAPIGGHFVVCCGYDSTRKKFLNLNSWSATWGMAGYFEVDYDYWLNPDLASDMWTLRVTQ